MEERAPTPRPRGPDTSLTLPPSTQEARGGGEGDGGGGGGAAERIDSRTGLVLIVNREEKRSGGWCVVQGQLC